MKKNYSIFKLLFLISLLAIPKSLLAQDCIIDLSTTDAIGITSQGLATGILDDDEDDPVYTLNGNGWNAFNLPQDINRTDILTFEFKSTDQGEEHGIGFSNTLFADDLNNKRYRLYGTQNTTATSNQNYTYTGEGEWQTFSIPIGTYLTGSFEYIVLINDNDGSPETGNSSFKNIRIADASGECKVIEIIDYSFNFAPTDTNTPEPFIEDTGAAYGTDGDYGWLLASDNTPTDASFEARKTSSDLDRDQIRESYILFNRESDAAALKWEIAVPDGTYQVIVTAGEPTAESQADTRHLINVEDIVVVDFSPNSGFGTRTGVVEVTVTDGKITLDGSDGINAKINAIAIQSISTLLYPAVVGSTPADGNRDVALNATISANFLSLPNTNEVGLTSIDNSSIDTDVVKLYEADSLTEIDIVVNGTGGGDAINITVTDGLKENTEYVYVIEGVKDLAGGTIFPYSAKFITGSEGGENEGDLGEIAFSNQGEVASGMYSTLLIGPDDKLYGLRLSGEIDRWTINQSGTLADIETFNGIVDAYGGSRLTVGLAFDPNSTPDNLIAYVSHSTFVFGDGPTYDGKISRLTGDNLEEEQLILNNLPRSLRDHLTNSIVFDPNDTSVLYFNQGANSGGGSPDGAWGNRPERLLSAATLKLDLDLLPETLPLDVKTSEDIEVINNASVDSATMSDGSYNPYFTDAPLTIYASGVRNAYDLLWHSNGQLYIPTNGTAGGSQSPASVEGTRRPNGDFYNGQTIPAVADNDVQRDYLFRVDPDLPTGYFGHPNPLRGEFVLNEGAPSTIQYPTNITSDSNYRGYAFDFEYNKSPNGVIEYKTEGVLKGALVVCRYSGGSDLIALVPDGPNGDISTNKIGIAGFIGFTTPIDLVEDTNTGNIYVSDLATQQIILLTTGENVSGNGISISFQTPENDQLFTEDEIVGVTVDAIDADGSIDNIQLFLDDVLVRQERTAPYDWGANNASSTDSALEELAPGSYTLKAIATDNDGNTEETSISITKEGVLLSFASPENNDIYSYGDPLEVNLSVLLSDNLIDNIQLFLDDDLVGEEFAAPFEWSSTTNDNLLNIRVGGHTLKAVLTDTNGNVEETSIDISIIRNNYNPVSGTNIFVENMRKIPGTETSFPYDDRIAFQRSGTDITDYYFSEFSTVRIHNTGSSDLTISSINISNSDFELVDTNDSLEFVIPSEGYEDVLIKFVASEGLEGLREAELSIISDDATQSQVLMTLAGGYHAELFGGNELSPLEIMQVLGFDTQINDGSTTYITSSYYPTEESVASGEQGDLVLSRLWEQADPDEPISAFFLNVFMGSGTTNAFFINEDQSEIDGFRIPVDGNWIQSLLPRSSGDNLTGPLASAIGNIDGQFAISLNNRSKSTLGFGVDETTGDPEFLPVRAYQVFEEDGTVRTNAYYIIFDFAAHRVCEDSSCDYNDLGLYVSNIKPSEEIIVEEPTENIVHIRKRNASDYAFDGGESETNGQIIFLSLQDESVINQQWIEIDRGDGYYSYQKNGTDFCIDGNNSGSTGQKVYLWECSTNNQNQHWQKVDVGDGAYKLIKRNATGFAIDGGNNGVEGREIQLWDSEASSQNLHWFITPVSETSLTATSSVSLQKATVNTSNDFILYPNPTNDGKVFVDLTAYALQEEVNVSVTTVFGLVILSENIKITDQTLYNFDINNYSGGVYLFSVTDQNGTINTKLFEKL